MTREEQIQNIEKQIENLQAELTVMRKARTDPPKKDDPPKSQGLTDDELLEIALRGDVDAAQKALNEAGKQ